ncbi:glutaminase [Parenemella sanctibonifatiensis]|uniref:glutaminase n=2 Tax=Parenemella sanctibonifatiensis TaxID=2016505 RepID=A0A255EMP2_9ACTN|nr:glutaminase [Parenemella sanctibonifatiensis]
MCRSVPQMPVRHTLISTSVGPGVGVGALMYVSPGSGAAVEPSGNAFNEISLDPLGRPRNPMINIGAITTTSLASIDPDQRWQRIHSGLSAFAGRELEVDESVYRSELEISSRNMSLAYMVKAHDRLEGDPDRVVADYVRQCALVVDVRDLAVMGMTLANQGRNPITGEEVVPAAICRQVLSVMMTCGMYDAAGDWMSNVGFPAKSGVSGCIMGALPGQVGIGAFSPRLDRFGNSVRGVRVCERLSADMGLHLMQAPEAASHVLHSLGDTPETDKDGDGVRQMQLQGSLHFAASEAALRELARIPEDDTIIEIDLDRVTAINSVGKRMLREGVRRLRLDGHEVRVLDGQQHLGGQDQ